MLMITPFIHLKTVINWFHINEMKSNNDKCHLIVTNNDNVTITIGNVSIETTNTIELLGIIIDTTKLQ